MPDERSSPQPASDAAPSSESPGAPDPSGVYGVPGVSSGGASEASDPAFDRLREIWTRATAESIGSDLEEAHRIVREVRGQEQELATSYLQALSRLERWLRDR